MSRPQTNEAPRQVDDLDAGPRGAEARRGSVVVSFLERFGVPLLTVLVIVFFSLFTASSRSYPTLLNWQAVSGNQAVLGVLALAVIVPLICGQFDLSIGAILGISSIACAAAMSNHGLAWPVAALIGVSIGAVVGLFNGLIVTRSGVSALIVTLGSASVITGIVTWYTDGQAINSNISSSFSNFGISNWLGTPRPVFALVVVALVVGYLLGHTPYGRYLQAIGSNVDASRLVGINVRYTTMMSFVIAGGIAGFAGVLAVSRVGSGNPSVGPQYLLPAYAAAFLGATTIRPGRFNVLGTLVAILFIAAAVSGLILAGAAPWVQDVFNGAALLVAVTVPAYLRRSAMTTRPRASG